MEATQFDYATKNIPVPSEKDYSKKLIEKTEELYVQTDEMESTFLSKPS